MRPFVPAAILGAAVALATPALANVTVGNNDGGNCYPFSCFAFDEGTIYQQVYSASAFTGQVTFGGVRFYDAGDGPGPLDSATYTVSFFLTAGAPSASTTPGPGTLSTDFAANRGTALGTLGTFAISGSMPATLDLIGSPISYDPNDGNLLMQVVVDSVDDAIGNYAAFFQADRTGEVTSRAAFSSGAPFIDVSALRTTFLTDVETPEPASAAVLGLALAGLAGMRRRRA